MSGIRSLIIGGIALALPTFAWANSTCVLGSHPSISDADAETVASIVCGEVRKFGVRGLGQPQAVPPETGEIFRVSMRPLGQTIFLSLSHEQDGLLIYSSQLTLREIEEVPVAAPRLAEAVMLQKPVSRTASVDSLVGDETRKYHKKYGEFFFDLGIVGLAVPGTDVVGGAGITFGGSFETEDFAVLADLRFSGGTPSDDSAMFSSIGVGGRYYFTESNWAPFLTGGLAFTHLEVEKKVKLEDDEWDEWGHDSSDKGGLGAWVGIGIQALRHYRSRLTLDIRAELPFFEVGEKYYVPITAALTYGW